MNYQPIIGFEVHVELNTRSKMFCGCPADHFSKKPNTQTCPVCLGLPGALPVPNKKAIEATVLLGLALNCEIPLQSKFDRKHYFYPDLPKGYQISQYDEPFAVDGHLVIASEARQSHAKGIASPAMRDRNDSKTIRIRRVHLEEDTGKLIHVHVEGKNVSLIDFNRSGVPLIEIVTEPDIHSVEVAKAYLQKLQQIIRYLGISDCDMEKGSMRLEPNISLRELGSEKLPNYKVEVKNINSFRFVGKAIEYEIERQSEILKTGKLPPQETRGFNETKNITVSQRSKEEAHDYRYFPEPDIPPIHWTEFQISNFKGQIPELPDAKRLRLIKEYDLLESDATRLTESKKTAEFFEAAVTVSKTLKDKKVNPKIISNWLLNKKIEVDTLTPAEFVKQVLDQSAVVTVPAQELEKLISTVVKENEKAVADYRHGKESAVMFLLGQVMRQIKGKGNAQQVRQQLELFLKK